MNRKKLNSILRTVGMVLIVALSAYETTRPYGLIAFGFFGFILSGPFWYRRIVFDSSAKDMVTGTLVLLEEVHDEAGRSYRPHYEYIYRGISQIYVSPVSAFWFKNTKNIGDKVELLVQKDDPRNVRINSRAYRRVEYVGITIGCLVGIATIIYGISLF